MADITYVWDPIEDNVIQEKDENGNVLVDYTTRPTLYGSVLSQDRGGQVRHYHFDGQGNTTELTDENGTVTDTRKYSAFGEVTESTGTTEFPYEWGGKWGYSVANGFASIRRRICQASFGRWLSVDPDALSTGDFGYLFVSNRPAILIDPSGLEWDYCKVDSVDWRPYRILDPRGPQSLPICIFRCRCNKDPKGAWVEETYNLDEPVIWYPPNHDEIMDAVRLCQIIEPYARLFRKEPCDRRKRRNPPVDIIPLEQWFKERQCEWERWNRIILGPVVLTNIAAGACLASGCIFEAGVCICVVGPEILPALPTIPKIPKRIPDPRIPVDRPPIGPRPPVPGENIPVNPAP